MSLLDEDEIDHSRLIGLGLRLGQLLTGGTTQPLKTTRLKLTNTKVVLVVPAADAAVAGGGVEKRLSDLAALLGRQASVCNEV